MQLSYNILQKLSHETAKQSRTALHYMNRNTTPENNKKNCIISLLALCHTIPEKDASENIVGKRENGGNQHFLLFPQCFQNIPKRISVFPSQLLCGLELLSFWNSLKNCRLVKG